MKIMNKPKLNQPDVEQSTTGQSIHIDMSDEKIKDDVFLPYVKAKEFKPTQPDLTIEEVKKEWEDDDYTWEEDERFITIYKEHPLDDNIVKEILINKCTKNYECYDASDYEETSLSLTLEEHIRLTKTFKAKGWEV